MTSVHECHRSWTLGIAIGLAAIAIADDARGKFQIGTSAQTPPPSVEPGEATKARLQGIVKGIVSMWDKFDVVCLGEGHGSKDDSNLRIALIEHPDFLRKVNVIIVEWADTAHRVLGQFELSLSLECGALAPLWPKRRQVGALQGALNSN